MALAKMDPGEEPPSMLWGLDPVFSAFARLYVKDILQIKESCQVPGIYFYNLHPIYKVDVLGVVVYKRERDDFFCYGVDDSTGVINCLCWKNEQLEKEQDNPGKAKAKSTDGAQGSFNPIAELRKLREAQQRSSRLEIGELLRVRGRVKTSRQQREIMASSFYKVDDPVMVAQIDWMMEVLQLYRQCYDKPFQLNASANSGTALSRVTRATNILKAFLKDKAVTKFRPYDVQDLLQPLVSSQPDSAPADQEPMAGPSAGQQLRQLLQEVLKMLQDEGIVFRKVKSQDEVYHVTERDKDIIMSVKDIIKEDSRREKYAAKGCHILHILSAVRQRYSPNVSRAALERVVQSLECSSDIISTCDSHYIMS